MKEGLPPLRSIASVVVAEVEIVEVIAVVVVVVVVVVEVVVAAISRAEPWPIGTQYTHTIQQSLYNVCQVDFGWFCFEHFEQMWNWLHSGD